MGIAEEGDAIGSKLRGLLDGAQDALGGLIGQSVHQVEVEARYPGPAKPGGNLGRLLEGLDPVDGFLNLGIEILNAQARPVEARAGERFHMFEGDGPRIDLDRDLGRGADAEGALKQAHDSPEVASLEDRRRSAAPVNMRDTHAARQMLRHEFDLTLQEIHIGRNRAVGAGNRGVATAIEAKFRAEGNVPVERQGRLRR